MYEPATPPPDGARHVVIPCYSNLPDRDQHSVVLLVDENFIDLLKERLSAFEMDRATDRGLIRKAFIKPSGLFYVAYTGTDDEEIDPPDKPTELCRHLHVMDGDDGVVSLRPILGAELHIGLKDYFWFEWPGGDFDDGSSETYYTPAIELKDLPQLKGPGEMVN